MSALGFLFLALACLIGGIAPTILWFRQPELTKMQLFIEYWPNIVSGFVLLILGAICFEIDLRKPKGKR